MVYCDGGDIYSKIKASASKGKNFPEIEIVDWLAQMALALLYLHERKILHRDMKTQNIFLKNGKVSETPIRAAILHRETNQCSSLSSIDQAGRFRYR